MNKEEEENCPYSRILILEKALDAAIGALNQIENRRIHVKLNGKIFEYTYDVLPLLEKICDNEPNR